MKISAIYDVALAAAAKCLRSVGYYDDHPVEWAQDVEVVQQRSGVMRLEPRFFIFPSRTITQVFSVTLSKEGGEWKPFEASTTWPWPNKTTQFWDFDEDGNPKLR